MQLPLARSCPAGGLRRRRQGNSSCAAYCWRDALKKNANQPELSCNIPYPWLRLLEGCADGRRQRLRSELPARCMC